MLGAAAGSDARIAVRREIALGVHQVAVDQNRRSDGGSAMGAVARRSGCRGHRQDERDSHAEQRETKQPRWHPHIALYAQRLTPFL